MPGHYGKSMRKTSKGTSKRKSSPRRKMSPGRELQSKNTARRASPAQKRAADNARRRAAQAAKRRKPTPKRDTRKTGGQGGAKGANDQMAFQRFVSMTPAQQRHVMRMADGEHRRRTR
jgi:hypothetical protein